MKIFEGNKYSFVNKKDTQSPAEKFLYRQQLGNTLSDVVHNHKSDIVSKIREVANIHKYRRRLKGKCVEHESLYISLRLCYEYEIHEKDLAQNLLQEICICEGNLDTIFSILLPGHVIKNAAHIKRYIQILYPGFMSRTMRKKSKESFSYYLRKICESRDRFNADGCTIINQPFDLGDVYNPLSAAAVNRDHEMILTLLKYGADPCHRLGDENCFDPLEAVVRGLNSVFTFNNSSVSPETKEALTEEGRKGMECLRIFLRAVNSVPFDASTHINLATTDEEVVDDDKTLLVKTYKLHSRLAESFDYKKFMGVRSLQHLCRLTIRTQLTKNTAALPQSIQLLPLPTYVKGYLDLEYD